MTDPRSPPDTDPDEPDLTPLRQFGEAFVDFDVILDFEHERTLYVSKRGKVLAIETLRGLNMLGKPSAVRVQTPAARRTPSGGRPRARRSTKSSGGTSSDGEDDLARRARA